MRRVLIIGSGQAGANTAICLRDLGFQGDITLAGEEEHLPYERPPLSKEVLLGRAEANACTVLTRRAAEERRIALRLGHHAVAIDRDRRQVRFEDGAVVSYDVLVLATGARARPAPVAPGALTLRSADDAIRLREELRLGRRLLVLGGGVLGLEVASSAASLGVRVTVLESARSALPRLLPPPLGRWLYRLHQDRGVDLRLGCEAVEVINGSPGRCRTSLGDEISFDVLVAAVGSIADDALAAVADLEVTGGIVVDPTGRTSDSAIFAVGDCVRRRNPVSGALLGRETWQHAQNGPAALARTILGTPTPYDETPWFWSDQHGVNIQILGDTAGARATMVYRGEQSARSWMAFEVSKEARVMAGYAFNAGREMRAVRQIVGRRTIVDIRRLADPAVRLVDAVERDGLHC